MKVCILSFTGLNTDGSDATRILKEMRSLAKAGYEVKAIGLRYDKKLPEVEEYHGAVIERIEPPLGFDRQLQKGLKKVTIFGVLKRMYVLLVKNVLSSTLALFKAALKEDADVYHCFGIYSLIPGFLLKVLKGKKVVYDCVEPPSILIPRIKSMGPFAKIVAKITDFMEKILSSKLDYILVIPFANDILKKQFSKYNQKVLTLWNYPEFNFIDNDKIKQKYFKNEKKLFYMGALTKAKGLIKMVESLIIIRNGVPDVKLVIAGSFDHIKSFDESHEEVYNLIKRYKLNNNLVILGYIQRNKLSNYIPDNDIALHLYQPYPGMVETMASSSLYEYMAGGLAIVASDFPGFKRVIEDCKCGITVDPTNPKEIAEKIVYLIENPKNLRKMSINARRAFETKYNWSAQEKKLLKIYKSLIRGKLYV